MTNRKITSADLIKFEKRIVDLFEKAKIPHPIHLSGGNEKQLINIFRKINSGDYVFSTHRNHYHYLLAGGSQDDLERMILEGRSMHIMDRRINFFASAIVAGTPAIATGVALALKRQVSSKKVWCFVGDGAEDEGHFYEAVRYVDGNKLPCTFVLEDNDRSVETPKSKRHGSSEIKWPGCVIRYEYTPTYLHVGTGTGNIIDFSGKKIEETSF